MKTINILLMGKKGKGLDKPGGASRAMFEYANCLVERGHKVNVLISACNFHPKQHEYYDDRIQAGWNEWKYLEKRLALSKRFRRFKAALAGVKDVSPGWFDLKTGVSLVPSFAAKNIPEADVTIVLDWWALLWSREYPKSKGRVVWFIHTVFFLPPTSRGYELAALADKLLVPSAKMKEEVAVYAPDGLDVVLNGVNLEQFRNDSKVYNKNKRVCMVYYKGASFKGVEDGIAAFEKVRESHPEICFVMFGVEIGDDIPDYCEYHHNPPKDKIREIYSSCDIFIFPSRFESSGITSLEAMACKCAVAGTTTGGITDYAVPDEHALLSGPGDVPALAASLRRLVEDEELLRRISTAGHERIRGFSWAAQAAELEKALFA